MGDVLPGSPAADAHLTKGDVIRKFNGRDVKNFPELRSLVAQAELNKKIDVEVLRDGKPLKVSAELREQPRILKPRGPSTAWTTKSEQSFAAAKCARYNTGSR